MIANLLEGMELEEAGRLPLGQSRPVS